VPNQSPTPGTARFIIGTGRCGSTILSKMLNAHPDVCVLSEFLVALDAVKKYGERDVTGADLADICDCGLRSNGEFKQIARFLKTPEINFDMESPPPGVGPGNYRDDVYPELILLPLSAVFDDAPEAFEELVEFARKRPTRLLSQQLAALFEWVTARAGKKIWIERSGGTLAQLPELIDLFPNAKFLHLHRDPLGVALSMKTHHHMRLFAFKHYGLRTQGGLAWSDLEESDFDDSRPMSPRLREIFDHDVPLEIFLKDWNEMLLRAFASVKHLAPEQYAEITFEDLLAEPKRVLCRIVDFFELPDRTGWMDAAAAMLVSGKAGNARPSPEQRAMIEEHCHAGLVLLDRESSVASSAGRAAPT
jgi:hypothetical protein